MRVVSFYAQCAGLAVFLVAAMGGVAWVVSRPLIWLDRHHPKLMSGWIWLGLLTAFLFVCFVKMAHPPRP